MLKKENNTKLIGLFTIILILWSIFYLLPEILYSLFTSFLGILLLLLSAVFFIIKDKLYGSIYLIILIVIYRFLSFKEKFTLSDKSKQEFVILQHTINPNIIFDINVLERQVNQQEIDYYNEHGYWPWSEDVIQLYTDAIDKNPFIRTYSGDAVLNTRKIYNQTAILEVLSNQTKEGQMLLTGVQVPTTETIQEFGTEALPSGFGDFGYTSGLIENLTNDTIKCSSSGATTNNYQLERIKYLGKGGIFGEQMEQVTKPDYNNLENIIPGFKFVKGACNPCVALNDKPNYSCPFELKVKEDEGISPVWKKLWSI